MEETDHPLFDGLMGRASVRRDYLRKLENLAHAATVLVNAGTVDGINPAGHDDYRALVDAVRALEA